jgi:hypothetical protein
MPDNDFIVRIILKGNINFLFFNRFGNDFMSFKVIIQSDHS